MNDLEMTKLCAEAMGYAIVDSFDNYEPPVSGIDIHVSGRTDLGRRRFDPLHDDAQAMALVKQLGLASALTCGEWTVVPHTTFAERAASFSRDLNRAVVECVAKMKSQS